MTSTQSYFSKTVAVVTGGATGVGLALGKAMLTRGASAVILFDRDGDRLAGQIKRLARDTHIICEGVRGDVTSEADVDALMKSVVKRYGRIDFLFNNAGAGFSGAFEQQTNDDWARAFALNFYGALYGMRAVLPIMKRQGSGHIVNIVSGIAFAPMAQQTMYAATKAALNALTLALRYECWDDGIKLTSATPGTTATDIWGGDGPPDHAQTPARAAEVILDGVALNQRLVLGDLGDEDGAANAFNPAAASGMDDYLLDVARRRDKGEVAV